MLPPPPPKPKRTETLILVLLAIGGLAREPIRDLTRFITGYQAVQSD